MSDDLKKIAEDLEALRLVMKRAGVPYAYLGDLDDIRNRILGVWAEQQKGSCQSFGCDAMVDFEGESITPSEAQELADFIAENPGELWNGYGRKPESLQNIPDNVEKPKKPK